MGSTDLQFSKESIQGVDVTIDDQLGVYEKVPLKLFFCDPWNPNMDLKPFESVLNKSIYGKSLGQRIFSAENDEMRWVIQRLTGQISANDFKLQIQILSQRKQDTRKKYYLVLSYDGKEDLDSEKDWTEVFTQVVETLIQSQGSLCARMSTTADVFITEAIFKTLQLENGHVQSALNRAITELHSLATDPSLLYANACVSWGNTNSKPHDYLAALEAAVASKRPVDFIPFIDPDKSPGITSGLYLPYVGIEELFRRNLQRFVTSGRYIPCRAIIDTCLRVNILMNDARKLIVERDRPVVEIVESCTKDSIELSYNTYTKLEWNRAFAALAGYEMFDDGTVRRKVRNRDEEDACDVPVAKRSKSIC